MNKSKPASKRGEAKPGIFIGLTEIGNIAGTYRSALVELGFRAFAVVKERNPYYPSQSYDLVINESVNRFAGKLSGNLIVFLFLQQVITFAAFVRSLFICDIYLLLYGSSFSVPSYYDYPLLRFLGKKIVPLFCGCDIRHWSTYEKELQSQGEEKLVQSICVECRQRNECWLTDRLKTVKSAEKYSRVIISHPSMSQLLTKPYVRVYNPIDLSQYQCAGSGSEIPVIIHAPTNRDVKGTKHIVRVVEQLQSEGLKFKFVLIEGIDHEALRKQMLDADILVDSVLGSSAGLGMLSIEAMAMGLVVMTADTGDEDRTASGCPIIAVDLNSLAGQLCDAISNSDLRRALAREGKAYVAKFHSHTYVALEMLNVVNDPSSARIKHLPKYVELDDSYRRRIILEEKKARKGRLMRRLKLLLGK